MFFPRLAWLLTLGLAAMAGCGQGAGTTGTGTTSSSTSSTTGSSTTSTSTGTGGGGGSGGSNTTTTGTGGSGNTGTGGSGAGHFACSGQSPSLVNDVLPITQANCTNGASCHVPFKTAAGTYQYTVNRLADQCMELRLIVDPGHPEKSYLVDKVTGTNMCSGDSMPKSSPLLPDAEIQVLVDWICAGAQNN